MKGLPYFNGAVARGDWKKAIHLLQYLPQDFPYIERIVLANPSGILKADFPEAPETHREDFGVTFKKH